MANAVLNIASLDPDSLKQSLITYLQSQPVYSGYNFLGSNWSVILDAVCRMTFLRSYYVNMAYNETFLFSCQLIDNAISRAKELNYLPSSMTSSITSANLTFDTNGLTAFTIPAGTRFAGLNSNGSYVFTTANVYYQTSSTGSYNFSNVALYEGTYTSDLFNFDTSIDNQLFTLSNPSIDVSSLSVEVIQQNGGNASIFNQATNLFDLTNKSSVYFIQPAANGQYQIYFGDGVLSYAPQDGSVIAAKYRVTYGPTADGASNFNLLDNLGAENGGSISNINITASPSDGGANAESLASIKLNAPLAYQTQGRGVTSSDIRSLILTQFPAVRDAFVYGGGISPTAVQYGYILISCVSTSGNPLTMSLKNQVVNYLANLDLIHPFTKMLDANTLFLQVTSNVHVNFNLTAQTPDYYQTQVINTIQNFSNTNLELYNTPFRYTALTTVINQVDNTAIVSNETQITLKRELPLQLNQNNTLQFSFANPIDAGTVFSDPFVSNGFNSYLSDQANTIANGVLYLVSLNNANNVINYAPIGSVVYANGNVLVNNLNISSGPAPFSVFASPLGFDVYGSQNDILEIDVVEGINVNIVSS